MYLRVNNGQNDHRDIASTNYYQTSWERQGIIAASLQARALRLLLPKCLYGAIEEMRTGKFATFTRHVQPTGMEIIFDDLSEAPYTVFLSLEQFLTFLPANEDHGRSDLVLSVWTDGPTKRLELPLTYYDLRL